MRRTTLFSLLVIGAALTVVFGAGTFAPFTATDTISGGVTAGTLHVDLADTGDTDSENSLTFDVAAVCSEMAPGDTCSVPVQVCNGTTAAGICGTTGSNLEWRYDPNSAPDASISTQSVAGCFEVATVDPGTVEGIEVVDGDGAGSDDAMDPGESDTFTVNVTLPDDATPADLNDCQGATATIQFVVNVTQSQSPHN